MNGQIGPLDVMLLPFAECLVLVGIHSYLGLHVLRRQVIFVDLALAQIAALGTTIAFLFAIEPLSKGAYVFSLLATVLGAAVFSLTRFRRERIPQEAVIGLVYALAAAGGILIVASAPHGAEHIQNILTGQLLWVKGDEVVAAAIVYAAVGLFHFIFRHKFLAISDDPEKARAQGLNVRLWDFLFYTSFGLVITHSVRTAGVLLVFVFLVAPAIMALLLTSRLLWQLLIGWGIGLVVSVGGMAISYSADTATGPTVVSLYGAVLLVVAVGFWFIRATSNRLRATATVFAGLLVVGAVTTGFYGLGTWMRNVPFWASNEGKVAAHTHAQHAHGDAPAQLVAGPNFAGDSPVHSYLHQLEPLDLEARTEAVAVQSDASLLDEALRHAAPADEEMRLVIARRLAQLQPAAGAPHLVKLLAEAHSPLLRSDALDALMLLSHDNFGFDPWDSPETPANREALARWATWRVEPDR